MEKSIRFFKQFASESNLKKYINQLITPSFTSQLSPVLDPKTIDQDILIQGIVTPFKDQMERPSKFIRPLLVNLYARYLEVPLHSEKLYYTQALIECIHNNTLIIDDIQDKSELRRGKPAVYKMFGIDTSLNSSQYYTIHLIKNFARLLELNEREETQMIKSYHDFLLDIYAGVTFDVEWHKNRTLENLPDFDNFFSMLHLKTSRIIQFSIDLLNSLYQLD